eukprot:scaffold3903_cov60-Phaeocystis_antarctica.AAC.1
MAKSALSMGRISWCGGRPCASSMAVMPSDHTSARVSYLPFEITSGAIQSGVPMTELRLEAVELSCAATPKSASFTRPSEFRRMLALLMSLWMIARFRVCMYDNPRKESLQAAAMAPSGRGSSMERMTSSSDP